MKSILLDLDGTLVSSSPGIKTAFNYAFGKLQLPLQSDKQLSAFIGPPLGVTFANYFTEKAGIDHTMKAFREYYNAKGVRRVSLYTGISDLLRELNDLGCSLYVAASKHEPMTKLMLAELGVTSNFKQVCGSTPEHSRKADMINACLTEQVAQAAEAVTIGDTKPDVIGGQKTGVRRLGITWGLGSTESLQEHGIEIVCHQPRGIKKALSSL